MRYNVRGGSKSVRLTTNAAIAIVDRFSREVIQGRTFLEASESLIKSPSDRTRKLTKRLLTSQRVRAKVVEVINGGQPVQRRCYPVPVSKVWDLVTGKCNQHWYHSKNAGVCGYYTIETVWKAVCEDYGLPVPVNKKKSQGGGDKGGDNTPNIIVDGIPHVDNNPNYCITQPYESCQKQAFTAQLMNKLRQLVSVHQKRRYKRDTDDGFIDQDRLVDVVQGTNLDTVREYPHRGQRIDAAVQVFVDCSGSMGGRGEDQETACALALALGKSLQRLRVPLSIVAFDGSPLLVKGWNDKVEDTKVDRLYGGGGTQLPLAMEQCLPYLLKRRESRKIQVVLTDGAIKEHNNWWKKIDDYRATKGYECYGFGRRATIDQGFFDGQIDRLTGETMISTVSREVGNILIHKPMNK